MIKILKLLIEYKSFGLGDRIQKNLFLSKYILIICCFFSHDTLVLGQSVLEYKEIWVKESREFLLNNQKPLPYFQSGFHHFSREQDNALTEGLDSEWGKFPVIPGTPVPKSKKFDPAPQFNFEETTYRNPQFLPCYIAENNEESDLAKSVMLPRIRKPEYTSSTPLKLNFKFYGNSVAVAYDKLLSLPVNQPITKEIVIEFWKKFLVSNSNHLVNQLMIYRDRLGLNDWGYLQLIKTCSNALYPNDDAGVTLLTWALMIRSGYDIKIGFNQLGGSILYPAASEIFSVPSVKINGTKYYVDKSISSFPISSYDTQHPGAIGAICLKFNRSLNFQGEVQDKKIQFLWDKKLYFFTLKYNPEIIRFLEEYPQTDPELYFNAPMSFLSKESLFKQFRPVLSAMKKEEGAAFLQQFVQKAFTYRPYNDLFGYDRFMFPEELLFKEESNDKGKALLYAWMITNILNQKAALVEFPGFYSVAISFDQKMDGDNFLLGGISYTIADPTFDQAPIGLVMKEFYSLKPYIRPLKNRMDEENQKAKIWKLAMAFGAFRSGNSVDFLKDESGNSYITGYFKEKAPSGTTTNPTPFIAKFDENNVLVWMVKFRSEGKAFGLELKQLDKNEFYLAGSFRGKLECSGIKIQSAQSDPDLFFVQFNRNGEIGWMFNAGLDELEEDTKLFYEVKFTRSGDLQSVQLYNEDERSEIAGFQQSTNEGLCFIASRYQTTGMDKTSEQASTKANYLFRLNLKRMRQLGIDHSIAFAASLFNSMLTSGNQLAGSDLVSLGLEKMQPWGSSLPPRTETIQKIKLIKNEDGIVQTFTTDSKSVKILSFRIFNRCHIKIIPLDNNDLKIKVIDGIEYESGVFKEQVNSMLFDLSTGNVVIDMGSDHQIFSRNLSRETLK